MCDSRKCRRRCLTRLAEISGEFIPHYLGSQLAGDITYKLGGLLPLLTIRPTVILPVADRIGVLKTAAAGASILLRLQYNIKQICSDCEF